MSNGERMKIAKYAQNIRVNRSDDHGFGVVTVDIHADGAAITFFGVRHNGHIEDRVTDGGVLVHGVAAHLLAQSVNAVLRIVA